MSSDIVYLGVLHTEHWRVGLLFLKAGKNVLCEKPFAMNSRQVKDLVAAAKKRNVFLMEVTSNPLIASSRQENSLQVQLLDYTNIKY